MGPGGVPYLEDHWILLSDVASESRVATCSLCRGVRDDAIALVDVLRNEGLVHISLSARGHIFAVRSIKWHTLVTYYKRWHIPVPPYLPPKQYRLVKLNFRVSPSDAALIDAEIRKGGYRTTRAKVIVAALFRFFRDIVPVESESDIDWHRILPRPPDTLSKSVKEPLTVEITLRLSHVAIARIDAYMEKYRLKSRSEVIRHALVAYFGYVKTHPDTLVKSYLPPIRPPHPLVYTAAFSLVSSGRTDNLVSFASGIDTPFANRCRRCIRNVEKAKRVRPVSNVLFLVLRGHVCDYVKLPSLVIRDILTRPKSEPDFVFASSYYQIYGDESDDFPMGKW